MPSGGARKGAGRKPGAATIRSRAIADRMIQTGVSPLEVMLDAMRYFHAVARRAEADNGGPCAEAAEAYGSGASIAKDAAPFLHPRLANIQHSGDGGGPIEFSFVLDSPKDD